MYRDSLPSLINIVEWVEFSPLMPGMSLVPVMLRDTFEILIHIVNSSFREQNLLELPWESSG